jgi:hypothetical protein
MSQERNGEISKLPMFFILGRPRSGTTLLASLFDAHPNVMLPFECPLIINLYKKYSEIENWTEDDLIGLYEVIIGQRKIDSWRLDKNELNKNLLKFTGTHTFETVIKAIYLNFNSFFTKKDIQIVGDKNPVYSIYPETLMKLFPNAKFIHLTRDYRDNILSIKKVDFEAPITSLLAFRWKFAARRMIKAERKKPEAFYTLKYEELVANPELHLRQLYGFLNVEYDGSVLEFYKFKDQLFSSFDREHVERYHSSLLNPITADKVYAWRNTMAKKEVRRADLVVGKAAELLGYERDYKGGMLGPKGLLWSIYGYMAYQLRFLVDLLPFNMKIRIRNKGPLLAVLFNKYILGK